MTGKTDFNLEKGLEICELIAEGKPLTKICKLDGMPALRTVYYWLARAEQEKEKDKEDGRDEDLCVFLHMYTRARDDQADTLAEEIIEISDDSEKDFVDAGLGENDDGTPIAKVFNSEHVQRSRLRVDARKWVAAKLKPRKYGDKVETALTTPNGPLQIETTERPKLSKEEWLLAHGIKINESN